MPSHRDAVIDAAALINATLTGEFGVVLDIERDWLHDPEEARFLVRRLVQVATWAGSADPERFVSNLDLIVRAVLPGRSVLPPL